MVKKFQLRNGLEVLLIKSAKSPVVSVQMWVKTGSADERKKEEGISHFIEHLVFKGSRQFKTGEIAQVVEGGGGQLNAYTSFDQTVFYVTISKAFDDTAINVIREMMGYPLFDDTEIDNERDVVLEEIKRGEDSPQRRASQLLFKTVYKKHPYGIPVIGYSENIAKTFTPKKIRQFYSDRYSPANMTLVVAGDYDEKTMIEKVKKHFSDIPRTKVRRTKRLKEVVQKSPRIAVEKSDFQVSQLYVSWPGVKATSKDSVLLDLLMLCLGQGESSRLIKKVRNQKGLVQGIGSFSYSLKDPGIVAISANLKHEQLEDALSEINLCLEEIISAPVSIEEISKSARALESEKFYSFETVDGLSQMVGGLYFSHNDLKAFDKVMKQIDKATPADLLRVARKYLRPENLSCVYLSKDASAETNKQLKEFQKHYQRIYKHGIKQRPKSVGKPKRTKIAWSAGKIGLKKSLPERIMLSNGARLVVLKTSDSPVVSLKAAFLGGARSEVERESGVSELISRTWASGTKKMNEEAINSFVEAHASSISAFSGRNSIGLNLTTLSAFSKPMLNIFEQIFSESIFPAEVVEREKSFQLEQLKNRDDNPSRVCIMKMMEELFGRHPYHRDPMGSIESVTNLNRESVLAQLEKVMIPKNLAISLVGDIDVKEWEKSLNRMISQMGTKRQTDWPPVEGYTLKENRDVKITQNKEQAHVCFAFPGLDLKDKRRPTLDLLQSVLSGQGGRLFIELRDKASLAYSVAPVRLDGVDGGYFGTYIGCSPDKVDKAKAMMKDELHKLVEKLVPQKELDRARRQLIGRHDIGLQRNSAIASEMVLNEIYGLPYDEYLRSSDIYKKITAEDVQALATMLFQQRSVTSIVGP